MKALNEIIHHIKRKSLPEKIMIIIMLIGAVTLVISSIALPLMYLQ